MISTDYLNDIFKLNQKHKLNPIETNKLTFIYLFSWIGLVLFGFTSVFDIFLENYVTAVAQFVFLVVLVTNIYLIKENRWFASQAMVTLISYSLLILYLSAIGDDNQNNYIWSFSLPLFSIILFGTRKGVVYAFIFFLLFTGLLFSPFGWNNAFMLSLSVKVKSVLIYLGITLISYMYEYSKIKTTSDLENKFQNSLNEKKSKDDFISKLSHQIRTPLNNLMVISNLLSETKMDDKQKDMLETIQASTNNLVNVVNNISKVSSIDYGLMNVNLSFNLYSTINSTIRLFSSMNSDRYDIKLMPQINYKYTLIGDPIKIKQIFLNIIENLIKSANIRSNITVSYNLMNETSGNCEIFFKIHISPAISISGSDITPEGAIHEENPITDFSIARKLLEHKGSSLNIESGHDYTIISFKLTFLKSKVETELVYPGKTDAVGAAIEAKSAPVDLKDANVLLVEDNLINQKIVVLSIQKMVKNIDVANNGKEALDKFGTTKYDIILMDIQMPVMDGIVATKKIREIEQSTNTSTPIIAITANALAGDKEICLAAGMDDYVSKPFQVDVLLQKMKKLLNKSAVSKENMRI